MLTRDAFLIYLAAFLRAAAVGLVGVILAIALTEAGVSIAGVGTVIGTGLAGIAVMTAIVTFAADRLGRRRSLIVLAALTVLGYVAAAWATRLTWLLPAAFFGMLNGMGRDRGPAGALEQAMLPETADATHRTWVLAWYNLVLDAGHAVGGLAGVVPTLLVSRAGLSIAAAHRSTFLTCAASVAVSIVPYAMLSRRVEVARVPEAVPPPDDDLNTRRAVRKLARSASTALAGGFSAPP